MFVPADNVAQQFDFWDKVFVYGFIMSMMLLPMFAFLTHSPR